MLKRITIAKRMRNKLHEVKDELMRRRHHTIPEQGRWLASVLRGHYAYYAVPGNSDGSTASTTRSRGTGFTRCADAASARAELDADETHQRSMAPPPKRMHPFPNARFAAHPRQEPSAVTRTLGSVRGAARKGGPYRHRWSNLETEIEERARLPGYREDAVVRHFEAPGSIETRFYEVRAKSILNRVPEASRMPFKWTINPYRGCTHACTWCVWGEHPCSWPMELTGRSNCSRSGTRSTARIGRDKVPEVQAHGRPR